MSSRVIHVVVNKLNCVPNLHQEGSKLNCGLPDLSLGLSLGTGKMLEV